MTRAVTLFGTGTTLAALTMATTAMGQSYSNDTGGSVTFYGQASPAYLQFDDGEKSYGDLVDNTRSNTRVGFLLDQVLGNGQKLVFNFETALGAPGSSSFSQDSDPVWTWEKTDLRKIDLAWSGTFGTFSIGQGSMASDGIATNDLSGTTMASTVTTADSAGGYLFRLGDGDLSDVTIGNVFSDFDGGRKGRVRYDTPSFNGFTLAASYGQEILAEDDDRDFYDIAAFYQGDAGDMKVRAGLGYAWVEDDGDTSEAYAGSVSVLHGPTGLNGTLAAGGRPDGAHYVYGKAGWIANLTDVGGTAFSADYYSGQDFGTDGSESTQWGVQATQNFDDLNLEAYLGYAAYTFDDDSGADYQDASSVLAGIRWKF